jgi:DNA-directed RNA polymerase delta subunit
MLLNNYSNITEEKIRSMSHEELINAVLRLMNVKEVKAEDYLGAVFLPDDLADAFRGRTYITRR